LRCCVQEIDSLLDIFGDMFYVFQNIPLRPVLVVERAAIPSGKFPCLSGLFLQEPAECRPQLGVVKEPVGQVGLVAFLSENIASLRTKERLV
jgi:hypothetical protein